MEGTGQTTATQRRQEGELLQAIARGDQEALRKLYRAFERPLYTLGIRWLHDQALAEELVQEVTLRIWRRRFELRPRERSGGLLDLRRGPQRGIRSGASQGTNADAGRGSGGLHLGRALERGASWQQWQIATAVQNLPLEQQRIIHLAYVLQFTQSEIAKALNIPLGTVKTRLYQGLRTLRPMLAEIGITGVADA